MEDYLTYGTYVVAAVGAAAVYLAMPKPGRPRRALVVALAGLALGGLVATLYALAGASGDRLLFGILAVLAVGAAGRVVTHPKPVYAAIYFVMVVVCTAGLALLAGAEFLAAALVIVYAGAILVTYVFVIMLAQQPGSSEAGGFGSSLHYDTNAREPGMAVLAGFVLIATIGTVIVGRDWPSGPADGGMAGNTAALGEVLLSRFAVSVELAGVLLMVAMIGAIAIAQKRIPRADDEIETLPPGEAGRRASPF